MTKGLFVLIVENFTSIRERILHLNQFDKLRVCFADINTNKNVQYLPTNVEDQLQTLATAWRTRSLCISDQCLLNLPEYFIWSDRLSICTFHVETVQLISGVCFHRPAYAKSVYLLYNMHSMKDRWIQYQYPRLQNIFRKQLWQG